MDPVSPFKAVTEGNFVDRIVRSLPVLRLSTYAKDPF